MKTIALLFAIWSAAACSDNFSGAALSEEAIPAIQLMEDLGGMTFDQPVALVFPEDSADTGYIVEQSGRILLVSSLSGSWSATDVLNIEDRVNDRGREEGLLGLALDPEFPASRHIYVNYTADDPRRTVVSRFSMAANDLGGIDPNSEIVILEVAQPYSNHNGGSLMFGPDGFLYIGLGDGGSAGDPKRNGQDPGTLLGSIVRIDVSSIETTGAYSVPGDNPLIEVSGARPEIWAYGLRNPWRFSFDRSTGELWAADVGQNQREEVNIIEPGLNYGWNVMEGSVCYGTRSNSCNQEGLEPPVTDYGHNDGCSITGGYVYRGQRISALQEKYVYGDFCSGKVWSFDLATGESIELFDTRIRISSFAEDADGEIYVLSLDGGVYKFVDGRTIQE